MCLVRTQTSFHGFNVSSLRQEALEEYFKQPVLDTFDVRIVMAKPVGHMTDFLKTDENELIKLAQLLDSDLCTQQRTLQQS